ncbi:diadenylate cyclase CdaA [Candidatus Omnitrophota bacterium]
MDIELIWNSAKPIIEIIILWFIFYHMLVFFQGRRAFQVLRGIIILVVAFLLFQTLRLDTLGWLLTKFFAISIVGILVIFQPELRYGLARLGQHQLFSMFLKEEEISVLVAKITAAIEIFSKNKIGSLIAIARESQLKTFEESGIKLNCEVSSEILQSIFMKGSPLHDGGIIIHGERIVSAVCLFPLTENPHLSKTIGTRHRAAIGLSEQTDAVVIVVSEETGKISLALNGKLANVEEKVELGKLIKKELIKKHGRIGK